GDLGWAMALWSVVHAVHYGLPTVVYDGHRWTASNGVEGAEDWTEAEGTEDGLVLRWSGPRRSLRSQAFDRCLDTLVGGRESRPHASGPRRAVEVPRSDEDAVLGQFRHGPPGVRTGPGGPQVQACLGVLDVPARAS